MSILQNIVIMNDDGGFGRRQGNNGTAVVRILGVTVKVGIIERYPDGDLRVVHNGEHYMVRRNEIVADNGKEQS